MKLCNACGIEKLSEDFSRRSSGALHSECRSCLSLRNRNYYERNAEKIASVNRAWRARNQELVNEHSKARYARKPEQKLAQNRRWKAANMERWREIRRAYAKANPDKVNSYGARRRARHTGTPGWANMFFISEAYVLAALRTKLTGVEWTVDHIVPLRHKLVCGLHVENNLQLLTKTANSAKGNRHWPGMPI